MGRVRGTRQGSETIVEYDGDAPQVSTGGGSWLPQTLSVTHDDPSRPVRAVLDVEVRVDDGRPRVRGVTVTARSGREVTAAALRVPLARIVAEAVRIAADAGPVRPAGQVRRPPTWGEHRPATLPDAARGAVDALRRHEPADRRRERLALAAHAYVRALEDGRPAALGVAAELRVSEGTARNLIAQARRDGLLTGTDERRKGGKLTDDAVALLRDIGRLEDGS
jgi:hypothetical protein